MEFNGVSKLFPLEKNTRSTWKRKVFQLIILICYLLKRWDGFSDCKISWKLQKHIWTGYDIVLVFIDELITFIWAYGDKCCVVNNAILANVLTLSHEQTNSVISEWAHNSRQKYSEKTNQKKIKNKQAKSEPDLTWNRTKTRTRLKTKILKKAETRIKQWQKRQTNH